MLKNLSIKYIAITYAILAALFYGFGAPLSKLLLQHVSPYMMSSLLYFGAGIGMLLIILFNKKQRDGLVEFLTVFINESLYIGLYHLLGRYKILILNSVTNRRKIMRLSAMRILM